MIISPFACLFLPDTQSIEGRADKLMASHNAIECNLQLLGATGIEDKLQDGVPDSIAALRQAGLKVCALPCPVNVCYV